MSFIKPFLPIFIALVFDLVLQTNDSNSQSINNKFEDSFTIGTSVGLPFIIATSNSITESPRFSEKLFNKSTEVKTTLFGGIWVGYPIENFLFTAEFGIQTLSRTEHGFENIRLNIGDSPVDGLIKHSYFQTTSLSFISVNVKKTLFASFDLGFSANVLFPIKTSLSNLQEAVSPDEAIGNVLPIQPLGNILEKQTGFGYGISLGYNLPANQSGTLFLSPELRASYFPRSTYSLLYQSFANISLVMNIYGRPFSSPSLNPYPLFLPDSIISIKSDTVVQLIESFHRDELNVNPKLLSRKIDTIKTIELNDNIFKNLIEIKQTYLYSIPKRKPILNATVQLTKDSALKILNDSINFSIKTLPIKSRYYALFFPQIINDCKSSLNDDKLNLSFIKRFYDLLPNHVKIYADKITAVKFVECLKSEFGFKKISLIHSKENQEIIMEFYKDDALLSIENIDTLLSYDPQLLYCQLNILSENEIKLWKINVKDSLENIHLQYTGTSKFMTIRLPLNELSSLTSCKKLMIEASVEDVDGNKAVSSPSVINLNDKIYISNQHQENFYHLYYFHSLPNSKMDHPASTAINLKDISQPHSYSVLKNASKSITQSISTFLKINWPIAQKILDSTLEPEILLRLKCRNCSVVLTESKLKSKH